MTRRARDAVDPDLHNPGDALEEFIRAHCNARDVEDGLRLVADLTAELTEMGEAGRDELGVRRGLGPRRELGARDVAAADSLAFDASPASAAGQRELRQAAAICSPILGDDAALAYDDAETMIRAALRALGNTDARTVHRSALPTLLAATLHTRRTPTATPPGGWSRPHATLAMDSDRGFRRAFPNLAAVRSLG